MRPAPAPASRLVTLSIKPHRRREFLGPAIPLLLPAFRRSEPSSPCGAQPPPWAAPTRALRVEHRFASPPCIRRTASASARQPPPTQAFLRQLRSGVLRAWQLTHPP